MCYIILCMSYVESSWALIWHVSMSRIAYEFLSDVEFIQIMCFELDKHITSNERYRLFCFSIGLLNCLRGLSWVADLFSSSMMYSISIIDNMWIPEVALHCLRKSASSEVCSLGINEIDWARRQVHHPSISCLLKYNLLIFDKNN